MNNREDQVRRLGIAGDQSPTPEPRERSRAPRRSRGAIEPTTSWSIVDGWVRDPAIRRHALIALALVLGTIMTIVCVTVVAASPLIRDAAASTAARIAAGSVFAGLLGYGGVKARRRRAGRRPPS